MQTDILSISLSLRKAKQLYSHWPADKITSFLLVSTRSTQICDFIIIIIISLSLSVFHASADPCNIFFASTFPRFDRHNSHPLLADANFTQLIPNFLVVIVQLCDLLQIREIEKSRLHIISTKKPTKNIPQYISLIRVSQLQHAYLTTKEKYQRLRT